MWKQTVTPNLDPYITQGGEILDDWLGWCLAYVQFAYGAGWSGASALDCWNNYTVDKRADGNIPQGVYVPIFFNGYGGLGHAAIVRWSGNTWEMWSSPISHKPYADKWAANSLQGLINIIKNNYSASCNYLGWAHGMKGMRFISYEEVKPVIADNQRQIGATPLAWRDAPNTQSNLRDYFDPGAVITLSGYVHGQKLSIGGVTSDLWGVGGITGGYMWLPGTTDPSTKGLKNLTPTTPVLPPTPPPVPPKKYEFAKDLNAFNEVIPAALGNFAYGEFPASPEGIVLHDFGTANKDTVTSVTNTFSKTGTEVSAHGVFSGTRAIQMVSLKDRAYHAKSGNSNYGFELDPAHINDPIQVANVRTAIRELQEKHKKKLILHKHPEFVTTSCGDDIDLRDYEVPYPYTPTPPVVVYPETPSNESIELAKETNSLVKQILELLNMFINKFNKIFK